MKRLVALLLLASLSNPVPLRAEEPLESVAQLCYRESPEYLVSRTVVRRCEGVRAAGSLRYPEGYPPPGTNRIGASVTAEEPTGEVGTALIGGWATWYEDPRKTGFYAAAGPVLREALGDWRGRYVTVEAGDRSVVVHLTDWCACGRRGGLPTLLDLSREAFAALGDSSLGVLRVSIEIDGSPRPDPRDDSMRDEVRDPLPQTDTL